MYAASSASSVGLVKGLVVGKPAQEILRATQRVIADCDIPVLLVK